MMDDEEVFGGGDEFKTDDEEDLDLPLAETGDDPELEDPDDKYH